MSDLFLHAASSQGNARWPFFVFKITTPIRDRIEFTLCTTIFYSVVSESNPPPPFILYWCIMNSHSLTLCKIWHTASLKFLKKLELQWIINIILSQQCISISIKTCIKKWWKYCKHQYLCFVFFLSIITFVRTIIQKHIQNWEEFRNHDKFKIKMI